MSDKPLSEDIARNPVPNIPRDLKRELQLALNPDLVEEAAWNDLLIQTGSSLPWITDPARRKELGLPEIQVDDQAEFEG